jgi:hypothetical protein
MLKSQPIVTKEKRKMIVIHGNKRAVCRELKDQSQATIRVIQNILLNLMLEIIVTHLERSSQSHLSGTAIHSEELSGRIDRRTTQL